MTEPYELPKQPRTDAWIERVRAADNTAEEIWQDVITGLEYKSSDEISMLALVAIAAELRAARIARRPGAGQK